MMMFVYNSASRSPSNQRGMGSPSIDLSTEASTTPSVIQFPPGDVVLLDAEGALWLRRATVRIRDFSVDRHVCLYSVVRLQLVQASALVAERFGYHHILFPRPPSWQPTSRVDTVNVFSSSSSKHVVFLRLFSLAEMYRFPRPTPTSCDYSSLDAFARSC
jgi:hypothetical protein